MHCWTVLRNVGTLALSDLFYISGRGGEIMMGARTGAGCISRRRRALNAASGTILWTFTTDGVTVLLGDQQVALPGEAGLAAEQLVYLGLGDARGPGLVSVKTNPDAGNSLSPHSARSKSRLLNMAITVAIWWTSLRLWNHA